MRRYELSSNDEETDFKYLTQKVDIGQLGIVDKNGFPRIIPLNFVALDGSIYFHGAKDGEKFELFQLNPKVTFSIYQPYSYIPSYFTSGKYGCPATHFFKSLHIRGTGYLVDSVEEKAVALQALLAKYQGEERHQPIDHNSSLYKKALQNVAVFKINVIEITYKIKFGQNETDNTIQKIIDGLLDRGDDLDIATIEEVKARRQK